MRNPADEIERHMQCVIVLGVWRDVGLRAWLFGAFGLEMPITTAGKTPRSFYSPGIGTGPAQAGWKTISATGGRFEAA